MPLHDYVQALPINRFPVIEPLDRVRACPFRVEISQCEHVMQIITMNSSGDGYTREMDEETIQRLHHATELALAAFRRKHRESVELYGGQK